MTDNVSVATKQMYSLVRSGRIFPQHGFTSGLIIRKRFAENTTPLAISVGLALPILMELNKKLDEYVVRGMELTLGMVMDILKETVKERCVYFADELSRVAVQTALCCVLLRRQKPYSDSAVYLWDMCPRLHQYYVAEVVSLLKLPPFLVTLVGKKPTETDIEVHTMPISAIAALEDSFKRNAIIFVGDVVVDTVGFCIKQLNNPKRKPLKELASQAAARLTMMVCKVSGAAAGRQVGGARGEYWGEIVGVVVAPVAFAQITYLFITSRKRRSTSANSGGERRTRSRSKESKEGGSRSSSHRTPLDKTS